MGLGLTLIGFIIMLIGFTMAGWQMDKYHQETPSPWYRTVHFN
ncbi:hypothetical protein RV12_GL000980 [Enterococcus quebecensis]|nr:hypothetical protein RV12_GL000980 [Enterococcus quebecensis]